MNEYFSQFPIIQYNGSPIIDVTNRVAILNKVFGDRYAFYPYTVKNGMRAEQVADKYYGDPNLVWLVYLSNNIIDPYYQWPMTDENLNAFIEKKYGSLSAASSKIAFYRVNWYEDDTVITSAEYNNLDTTLKKYWEPRLDQFNKPSTYVRKELDHKIVGRDGDGTVDILPVPDIEKPYWSAVSQYDVEVESNADKANIRLLDNRLSSIAVQNLKELLSS